MIHCNDFEQSHLAALLSTWNAHAGCAASSEFDDCLDRNHARMHNHAFRVQGLGVGTETYWSVDAVHTTLSLRCCILWGGYENYWPQRAQTPKRRGLRRPPDDERQPRRPGGRWRNWVRPAVPVGSVAFSDSTSTYS